MVCNQLGVELISAIKSQRFIINLIAFIEVNANIREEVLAGSILCFLYCTISSAYFGTFFNPYHITSIKLTKWNKFGNWHEMGLVAFVLLFMECMTTLYSFIVDRNQWFYAVSINQNIVSWKSTHKRVKNLSYENSFKWNLFRAPWGPSFHFCNYFVGTLSKNCILVEGCLQLDHDNS